ncbi:tubulin folding cofactor D C terminal-domain-containing protein [Gongronella butleri]|nr:tubulin folding cofactor D C terminal-domain-containing protein [Gongronella butleri]
MDDAVQHTKSHFEHKEAMHAALMVVCDAHAPLDDKTAQVARLATMLDEYQEQAHLLDPYLEGLVDPIMTYLRQAVLHHQENIDFDTLLPAFRFLYLLTKTRGYKTIVKFMSHEVTDLEPVFSFLNGIDGAVASYWEIRFVSFIWLSLICMIPFDLQKVDSGDTKASLVDNLLCLCKRYLCSTGKEREGASLLVARLISRRDVHSQHLLPYLQWCKARLTADADVFETTGILTSLCYLYQVTERDVLFPTLDDHVLPLLTMDDVFAKHTSNAVIRKLRVKLTQRVGLAYLKPKIASWRYQRGHRSLRGNLDAPHTSSSMVTVAPNDPDRTGIENDDDDEEIPENVETILDLLFTGLRDKDTIVRWSAAKGMGRITQRLPEELAQDVVGSLLELFEENTFTNQDGQLDMSAVSDSTWHGVSLAIAELARRGLLLPAHLDHTLGWINLALKFDLKRGSHSIGAHVRDAACYVCWSFARAYAADIMTPHVHKLAPNLIVATVFDREVNVRRASSAAFQENVGRQGIFPHGIDIIQLADYFSIGNRNNAFMNVAVAIARFDSYRYHLIRHLLNETAKHWDKVMRVLASKTLYALVPLDPDYFIREAIPYMIPLATSKDMQIAHGALLALSEMCLALHETRQQQQQDALWHAHPELTTLLADIIAACPPKSLTTFGSEHIREALCQLVGHLARTQFPATDAVLASWKQVVLSSLERKEEQVQQCAVDAYAALTQAYGMTRAELDAHLKKIDISLMIYARRGYALTLGTIDYNTPDRYAWLHDVVYKLGLASKVQAEHHANDPESKRNAIVSLGGLLRQLDDTTILNGMSDEDHQYVVMTLENGLKDYSTDQRGDVGSWVRSACMECIGDYIPRLAHLDAAKISSDTATRLVAALLKQSVERIDRVRELAGKVLLRLLATPVLDIANVEELTTIITSDLEFGQPSELYPVIVECLALDAYRFELLTGLVASAGALTESLVRHASASLLAYMEAAAQQQQGSALEDVLNTFVAIFAAYDKQDRVTLPLMDVLGLVYESGLGARVHASSSALHNKLFNCLRKETLRTRNVKKLLAAIKIYVGLIWLPGTQPVKTRSLQQLLAYLLHAYPRVRVEAADQLFGYLSLLDDGDINDETAIQLHPGAFEAEELLETTDWATTDLTDLRPIRDQLYPLLDIPKPVLKAVK